MRFIKDNPVITGKAAKQFEKMFLTNSVPSPERVEQNKKDVATYLSATHTRLLYWF